MKDGSSTQSGDLPTEEDDPCFTDLHPALMPSQAIVEASRCLYCYGAPCITACPTGIDIPTFIHQIRTANVPGAARTILSANIMGGTCARACPTEVLCERDCVVHHLEGGPVKIGALQRYAVDSLLDQGGEHPFQRQQSTGRHVAVIGAGPAGLSFAHSAAMLGNDVTVFEAKAKGGGLNEYGLAAYKMVDNFAQREIEFLLGVGGVTIRKGVSLGVHLTLQGLLGEFDAIFLGVGLGTARSLRLAGRELSGVRDALQFIEEIRQTPDKRRLRVGANVIVIGGGNTAIDAAVQAKRLGAENVVIAYRRGPDEMTATPWERDLARTSDVVIRYWLAPVAFEGRESVARVAFRHTQRLDGKPIQPDETLPADMVLVAVGQRLDPLFYTLHTDGGKIWVDSTYQTSHPGVYAGGDCIRSGEDLTVQAVEDGKRAAISVDAYLRTQSPPPAAIIERENHNG